MKTKPVIEKLLSNQKCHYEKRDAAFMDENRASTGIAKDANGQRPFTVRYCFAFNGNTK
jgi:hypothetical protein